MDFSIPNLNTAISLVFTILLLQVFYHLLKRSRSVAKGFSSPPEADGAWPLIGHLHLLKKPHELPHITLGAMADKYGPIFNLRLGVHRSLVVSGWEIAKECFTRNDIAVSSRPKFLAAKHFSYDYAMFGFSPYGPYWRELRKIVSLELLSSRRLQLHKKVQVFETETSIKELYEIWRENKISNSSESVLVDMKTWFGDLTLNVILKMVVGKRLFGNTAAAGSDDERERRRCQRVMREIFHLLGVFAVSDFIPFVGWFEYMWGYEKVMKETAKELDIIVEEWLEEHRRRRESGEGQNGHEQDFMDVMFSVLEGGLEIGGFDADTVNKSTCVGLITGGADTTTVILIWALSLLMNHGPVLKKAQQELDFHVGRQRQVEESDLTNLVYLQAIVKETLRLYPAGPLSGPREFTEDCTIGGYHVPRGTRLILNLWKLQRDPRVWSDPLEFLPERFLTGHKDVDMKGQSFELIPFGAGRRACPGITFGIQMLHLVLASLLHGFDLSTPDNDPVDMTESAGMTNVKATPLEVLITPRLSDNLY